MTSVVLPNVQQFLQTRFNVSMKFLGLDLPSDDWMERRMELFLRFTVPSVAAQANDDFEWVIYCATATRLHHLRAIKESDPRVRIVMLGPANSASDAVLELADHVGTGLTVRPLVRPTTEMAIISRMDNDDAISLDYTQTLRELVPDVVALGHPALLHVPVRGYRYLMESQTLYQARHDFSPFQTLFMRVDPGCSLAGPLATNHMRSHEQFPTYFDRRAPMWLQVVHGENISNKVKYHDKVAPLSDAARYFGLDLSGDQPIPSSVANPGT